MIAAVATTAVTFLSRAKAADRKSLDKIEFRHLRIKCHENGRRRAECYDRGEAAPYTFETEEGVTEPYILLFWCDTVTYKNGRFHIESGPLETE